MNEYWRVIRICGEQEEEDCSSQAASWHWPPPVSRMQLLIVPPPLRSSDSQASEAATSHGHWQQTLQCIAASKCMNVNLLLVSCYSVVMKDLTVRNMDSLWWHPLPPRTWTWESLLNLKSVEWNIFLHFTIGHSKISGWLCLKYWIVPEKSQNSAIVIIWHLQCSKSVLSCGGANQEFSSVYNRAPALLRLPACSALVYSFKAETRAVKMGK